MNQKIIDAKNLKLSPLYQKIVGTKRGLEKNGLDEDEADEEAWEKRRHALKIFMRDNKDQLGEWIFPEEEEEEEEEEDDE